ncbi:MAG: D-citramalate synthase [Gammaproteobacteria bacterium]|jgi:D-citramalate synthase
MNSTAPRHIELMDTTLRDGEQTQGVSFTPDEKVNIAKALLGKLNVDRIEIASAKVSAGEKFAVTTINEWAAENGFLERVEVLGFVDNNRSVDWVVETGGKTLNLLTKGSEKHCRMQLRKTLDEHIVDILKTVEYAFSKGLKVNMYLEDWSNGYRDNPEYVYGLMNGMKDSGVSRYLLPDTLGVLGPDDVYSSISQMVNKYPGTNFDFHPHNDYGLATANVMAAVKAGVNAVHCTVNCLGERAGNASVAEVGVILKDKMGMKLSINEEHIFDISKMVENFSGKRVAANMPIVGTDVFTQTAGIHADGDQKGGLYESILSPVRFDRKRSYALGKLSGKASLIKNLEELDLSLSDENLKKVLQRIVELGDSKQTITRDDLPFIIADVLESKDYNHVTLVNCSITSGLDLESTVSLQVKVGDKLHKSSGTGNGGFDAFISAINKVLKKYDYKTPKLVDFEVRIPKGGETNALTEAIIIWQCPNKNMKTRGVHANQVFAAIQATLRLINIQFQEREGGTTA